MLRINDSKKIELIGSICAAGIFPDEWSAVVGQLSELIPFGAIAFQHIDLYQRSPSICLLQNWPDGALEAYTEYYAAISPWLNAHRAARTGESYTSDRTCPSSSYEMSEFYSDFVRPYQVMCGAVAVKAFDDTRSMTTLSVNYPEHLGEAASAPIAQLLDSIIPHVQRAIALNRKVCEAEASCLSLGATIDAMLCPAILVNVTGRVEHMNRPAQLALGEMS